MLQQEMLEQRIRHASESEHWQTIEALFSETRSMKSSVKDAMTNTEDNAPKPAERKLVSQKPNLVDKNLSPIGSPIKTKTEITDISTSKKSSTNVLIQTELAALQSQAIQTLEAEESLNKLSDLKVLEEQLKDAKKTIEERELCLKNTQKE